MTDLTQGEPSDGKSELSKRVRKPLPKSKKLNNTQILKNNTGGLGGPNAAAANFNQTMPCATPQQNLQTYCSLC